MDKRAIFKLIAALCKTNYSVKTLSRISKAWQSIFRTTLSIWAYLIDLKTPRPKVSSPIIISILMILYCLLVLTIIMMTISSNIMTKSKTLKIFNRINSLTPTRISWYLKNHVAIRKGALEKNSTLNLRKRKITMKWWLMNHHLITILWELRPLPLYSFIEM